jgi:hypothetical protein
MAGVGGVEEEGIGKALLRGESGLGRGDYCGIGVCRIGAAVSFHDWGGLSFLVSEGRSIVWKGDGR